MTASTLLPLKNENKLRKSNFVAISFGVRLASIDLTNSSNVIPITCKLGFALYKSFSTPINP